MERADAGRKLGKHFEESVYDWLTSASEDQIASKLKKCSPTTIDKIRRFFNAGPSEVIEEVKEPTEQKAF